MYHQLRSTVHRILYGFFAHMEIFLLIDLQCSFRYDLIKFPRFVNFTLYVYYPLMQHNEETYSRDSGISGHLCVPYIDFVVTTCIYTSKTLDGFSSNCTGFLDTI